MAHVLEVRNITKKFGAFAALTDVSLSLDRGDVHALCGENGAGKSTLMNIIGGVFSATEGEILIDGAPVAFHNPRQAQEAGIGFVHQELSLCQHLSVAENIFIGRLPKKNGIIDKEKLREDALNVLSSFNVDFDPDDLVGNINISEQQIVEIARAVSLDCRILILDEPTSSLTEKETENLMRIIRELKSHGMSILYISHRLSEIFEVCNKATVLKDGHYIWTKDVADISSDDIITAMVGRSISSIYPPKAESVGEEILSVGHLSRNGYFHDISFNLRKGEILGIAGLVGAGRSEIMRSLCGIDPCDEGSVRLFGKELGKNDYRKTIDEGICYLPEDRKLLGLFVEMSIENNIIAADTKAVSGNGMILKKKAGSFAARFVKELNVKIGTLEDPISSLSGGNQQKCLIAKWLAPEPKVLILDEPTRGIDVGSKVEIHRLLRKLADRGVGIIMVSSELPEVIGVSDRVAVICEGSLAGFLSGDSLTEENIMRLASGKEAV